ncbi:MAG: hypothetical protein HY717_13955 [Planctomycetes bacterium]|nr:hypothetical protein [Planctomycetota bacterium]
MIPRKVSRWPLSIKRSSRKKAWSEKFRLVFLCLLPAAAGLALPASAVPAQTRLAGKVPERLKQPGVEKLKPLFCRATPVAAKYSNSSSGYTAMVVGPDGRVYVGTANYYDYGYWLAYNPKDRSVVPVLDIMAVTAEYLFDVNTQGKTHTKLAVGPDGKIYGGTKQGHELFRTRPEIGEQPGGYPGGHLLCFDPVAGIAQDLGILRAQDGLMNCIVDRQRRRIYFKTEPRTHFLIYEIDTRQVIDKGRVGTWNRYIDMDGRGDVWIPNYGRMTRYDVKRDELADLRVEVEGDGPAYSAPYACVIGGRGGERGMKLYGGDLRRIQEFDLARSGENAVPMRYACRAVPEPYEKSSDIHAMVRDRKGRICWPAVVSGSPDQLLIMRYDPDAGKAECLGYAVDTELEEHKDVKNHTAIQGADIGEDGTLYLMGTYPYYILEFPQLATDQD